MFAPQFVLARAQEGKPPSGQQSFRFQEPSHSTLWPHHAWPLNELVLLTYILSPC